MKKVLLWTTKSSMRCNATINKGFTHAKKLMLRKDVKKAAQTICQTISFQLVVFPRLATRETMMQKVL
jgi:hypothetical protein